MLNTKVSGFAFWQCKCLMIDWKHSHTGSSKNAFTTFFQGDFLSCALFQDHFCRDAIFIYFSKQQQQSLIKSCNKLHRESNVFIQASKT